MFHTRPAEWFGKHLSAAREYGVCSSSAAIAAASALADKLADVLPSPPLDVLTTHKLSHVLLHAFYSHKHITTAPQVGFRNPWLADSVLYAVQSIVFVLRSKNIVASGRRFATVVSSTRFLWALCFRLLLACALGKISQAINLCFLHFFREVVRGFFYSA